MIKNILIIFMSLILFELILRFSLLSGGQASARYDKEIGYWHKANFVSRHTRDCYDTEYSFGEYGEISPISPYSNEKEKITLLGNSYIEAVMVKNKFVVHNALSTELNHQYDVLNFGLYGSNLYNQALIYQYKVPNYKEAYTHYSICKFHAGTRLYSYGT